MPYEEEEQANKKGRIREYSREKEREEREKRGERDLRGGIP